MNFLKYLLKITLRISNSYIFGSSCVYNIIYPSKNDENKKVQNKKEVQNRPFKVFGKEN